MENSTDNCKFYFIHDEEHVIHSKRDSIEIMINNEADKVGKQLFDSLNVEM